MEGGRDGEGEGGTEEGGETDSETGRKRQKHLEM